MLENSSQIIYVFLTIFYILLNVRKLYFIGYTDILLELSSGEWKYLNQAEKEVCQFLRTEERLNTELKR